MPWYGENAVELAPIKRARNAGGVVEMGRCSFNYIHHTDGRARRLRETPNRGGSGGVRGNAETGDSSAAFDLDYRCCGQLTIVCRQLLSSSFRLPSPFVDKGPL